MNAPHKRIDNREFVVAYINSSSIDELARAIGTTKGSVSGKATFLRKKGVRLPKFTRGSKDWQFEVAQLNALVKKHSK